MSKQEQMNFSEFYINEFFDQVRDKTKADYPEPNYKLLDELFRLLSKQEEITEGIGKLAEQQASSELSIFLFDIFDRAQDYPATELLDALPEIADDFVSGLTMMLEEEKQIIPSIEKVINDLKGETEGAAEDRGEAAKEEKIEEPAPLKETIRIEKETEKEVLPRHNLAEFIELDFFDRFQKALEIQQNDKESKAKLAYTRLVIQTMRDLSSKKIPSSLERLVNILAQIFPWQLGQSYAASEIITGLPAATDDYVKAMTEINSEEIIQSINEGKLIFDTEEAAPVLQKEEVPERPTTIDKLLSDYFQLEANEHVSRLKQNIAALENSPDSTVQIKNLLDTFQSLKEISMIHGYVLLEDFCSEIIASINDQIKSKIVYNTEMRAEIDEFLGILATTDKVKDAREKTAESLRLENLQEVFLNSLFISGKKKKKQEKKKEKKAKAGKRGKTVEAANQKELIKIYKSLLRDLKPVFKETLSNTRMEPDRLIPIMDKLTGAAKTIGNPEIIRFITNYARCIAGCNHLKGKKVKSVRSELMTLYNAFTMKASPEFKFEQYESRLKKILDALPAEDDTIHFKDSGTMLRILMENEKSAGKKFVEDLKAYLMKKDPSAKERQHTHFKSLAKNLALNKASRLFPLPEYFIHLFETEPAESITGTDIEKAGKEYNRFIETVHDKGSETDVKGVLDKIRAFLSKPEEKEIRETEEASAKDSAGVSDEKETLTELISEAEEDQTSDTGDEEDLDLIFKQESEKYISIIDTALNELNEQPDNQVSLEKIEKSLHSLKSSSRLMGFNEVADLCGPFEKVCEKLRAAEQALTREDITDFEAAVQGLKAGIAGEKVNSDELIERLNAIRIAEMPVETESEKEGVQEEQLFSGSADEDEDLLDIFKDESSEYISIIEKAKQSLTENLTDREALGQLENATHSLKTAAKMLGFSEIGELADGVETATVAILKGEIKNHPAILDEFARAIGLIKELTSGQKQNINQVDKVSAALNISQLKENEAARPQTDEQEMVSVKTPELDEQTQLFVKEGWELLEKINRDLLNLEKHPDNEAIITDLNRTIHTLKGSAQILNFRRIGELAHKIEDLFIKSRDSGKGLDEKQIDSIFKAVDVIQALIKSIRSGGNEEHPDVQSVLDQINQMLGEQKRDQTKQKKTAIAEPPATKPKVVGIENDIAIPDHNDQFIKITTDNLDKLINMAAELVINKTQLTSYLEKLRKIGETIEEDKKRLGKTDHTINSFLDKAQSEGKPDSASLDMDENGLNDLISATTEFKNVLNTFDTVSGSFRAITRDFEQNIGQISSLSKSLHDDILQVRLVPTELLFNRYPRAVRDMAKKMKKKVNLVVEGEQTEMDRALIESLTDPVMHLVRNAIDHGLETPEERIEQGKSEDGILLLKARRSKNQIIIEVQDDGRGIDPAVIKNRIVKNGLASKKEAEQMSVSEIMDYVFKPGFSTVEKASDLSGRGVGLDVVASQIQKLKGDIRISSTPGRGTIFSIRVPLTLAIAQAIMVKIGKEILAIPLSAIEETIQFKDPELVEKDERAFITVRDQLIPVAYLSSLLDYGDPVQAEQDSDKTAIIVREAGAMYGLIVDKVLGREEIVIKSLGDELASVPYISGGTVSGDGSIILILDVPSLTQKIKSDVDEPEEDFSAIDRARELLSEDSMKSKLKKATKKKEPIKPSSSMIKKKKVSGRKPVALIVDDSVSVRKFVSSVLVKNDYATILAEDGPEALEELEKNEFDIIITDLEMPKMQGFDLIAEIRKHRKFESIPIIILTGRAGKKHKDRGTELGANAYITKPFKESDLLNTLEEFISIS